MHRSDGELTEGQRRFLEGPDRYDTPYLVVDLDAVEDSFKALHAALPRARLLYAVKANASPQVIRRLSRLRCDFDVASPGEIETCMKVGVEPWRLSYGNPIKKERDIEYAYSFGVRLFAVDSGAELEKVIRSAPGSTVYLRINTDGLGADWPLSLKFGCDPSEAFDLAQRATTSGLGVGFSFHVGSQQRDVDAWDGPLCRLAKLFAQLSEAGIRPVGVNLGGGFPSSYRQEVASISEYGRAITRALNRHLGADFAGEILAEPGRYLVGDAGVIESEVVLCAERPRRGGQRWVYLDVGLFNGLMETLGEAIKYRVVGPPDRGVPAPAVLAGPTCDSTDVMYRDTEYLLPIDIRAGDRVRILAAGAYTSAYSCVDFNGLGPLATYFVSSANGIEDSD